MYILGISAFYHDAAAALIKDGEIIAAAQEERFSRLKHDERFPINAIKYCLQEAHINADELDAVVFYEKPFLKFERLLETYLAFAPKGLVSFIKAISSWSKKKLFIKKIIRDELKKISGVKGKNLKIIFSEHHLSHAASAWFPSPFEEAAILIVDAVGEAATASIFSAKNNEVTCIKEMNFPHSIGLLYSAFTYYLGFKVNSGEYKLMGLAPYGNANASETKQFEKTIRETLCTLFDDGSIFINQHYFNYATGLTMANDKEWTTLFGFKRKREDEPFTLQHCNLALAIQNITNEIVIKLATEAKKITGSDNLCLAGGVALNCVANGKLEIASVFKNIYIQPAAGDAGCALGAALAAYHIYFGKDKLRPVADVMKGTYLGPAFSDDAIENALQDLRAEYEHVGETDMYKTVADFIADGKVVGWFQGRMEFGPRALGNRSILADPRNNEMQQKLNLKIKFREGFGPFAPAVLEEKASEYFDIEKPSPYMLYIYAVNDFLRNELPPGYDTLSLNKKLQLNKSSLPAVTHVDGTARVQTVSAESNPAFHKLLSAFEERTGCAVLINTSFNVRGEPIVCTPVDALRCFINKDIDILVMNNFILKKEDQQNIRQVKYDQLLND